MQQLSLGVIIFIGEHSNCMMNISSGRRPFHTRAATDTKWHMRLVFIEIYRVKLSINDDYICNNSHMNYVRSINQFNAYKIRTIHLPVNARKL